MKYLSFTAMLLALLVAFTVVSSAHSNGTDPAKCGTNCSAADRAKCTVADKALAGSVDCTKCDDKMAATCPIKNCPICPGNHAVKSSTSGSGNLQSGVKGARVVKAIQKIHTKGEGKSAPQLTRLGTI